MADTESLQPAGVNQPAGRQAWQEPAIKWERWLLAQADTPKPGSPLGRRLQLEGFLGPLSASPANNSCKY